MEVKSTENYNRILPAMNINGLVSGPNGGHVDHVTYLSHTHKLQAPCLLLPVRTVSILYDVTERPSVQYVVLPSQKKQMERY